MTDETTFDDLLTAARKAASYLCQQPAGDQALALGQELRAALAGADEIAKQMNDGDAAAAYFDTLTAFAAIVRETALPTIDGENRETLLDGLRAVDDVLSAWSEPIKPLPPRIADVLPFAPISK